MTHPVQDLFRRVAPRYDLLNRLFSLGRDASWRRSAARVLAPAVPGPILDLACGTLDLSAELGRRYPEQRVVGCDFSREMMAAGRNKLPAGAGAALVCGDGLALPFADRVFAAATISFGIRNIADRPACLAELARVVKPGGRLAVLELGVPQGRLTDLYLPYFLDVMPRAAGLLGARSKDYDYLGKSVMNFPRPADFLIMMEQAGFSSRVVPLTKGIANLFFGTRRA